MTRQQCVEIAGEDEELLFLDGEGMDAAILGVVERCTAPPIVCYDFDKVIAALVLQGMDQEEALEWYSFNINGAWVGDRTPFVLRRPEPA